MHCCLVAANKSIYEESKSCLTLFLLTDSKEKLRCLVRESGRVCERRKLKVNVGKSEILKFNESEERELLRIHDVRGCVK